MAAAQTVKTRSRISRETDPAEKEIEIQLDRGKERDIQVNPEKEIGSAVGIREEKREILLDPGRERKDQLPFLFHFQNQFLSS